MNGIQELRTAVERAATLFRKKPAAALATIRATGRTVDGLSCHVRQGAYEAVMDMPVGIGGKGSAPTPGFFVRAGLAGCIATGIKLTAVQEGIDIGAIDVDVEMDFDDGALLGVGDNSAAPLETRITVSVASAAPPAEIDAMVARALERDPFFLALRDAQAVTTRVVPPGP